MSVIFRGRLVEAELTVRMIFAVMPASLAMTFAIALISTFGLRDISSICTAISGSAGTSKGPKSLAKFPVAIAA